MRTLTVWAWTVSALIWGGCAPGTSPQEREFQLRKTEQERNTLRQQLAGEKAKVAACQQRSQATEGELNTCRAEVGHLNDRLADMTNRDDAIQAQLQKLSNPELNRPTVPLSPLPAATDEALQGLARKFGDRVWYDRGRGALSFANDRLFDSGSDSVRADAHAALHELAGVLRAPELADYEVIVVGHTDATPITKAETLAKHPTNWHLSVHRAIAVKDVLVKAGLPAERLGVMGYAENRPIGDDPARNRRVEVFVVRKGGVEPLAPVQAAGKKK
jgi:chemotaxis protein MotB